MDKKNTETITSSEFRAALAYIRGNTDTEQGERATNATERERLVLERERIKVERERLALERERTRAKSEKTSEEKRDKRERQEFRARIIYGVFVAAAFIAWAIWDLILLAKYF